MSNEEITIKIVAEVKTIVTLEEGETLEDVKNRFVDIYLHGAGEHGYQDKEDLGADKIEITIVD
ncbi:MAG: hypothetical protein GY714_01875 [Desulfobacterales bacterium]|nr:hypothetical protein [Desulfobacterales bacterium]